MNDAEARIERVLRGLREVEPAVGFEPRVLRAVREKASGTTRPKRVELWRVFPVAPHRYALVAMVVVLLVVLGSAKWWHRGQQAARRDGAGRVEQAGPARGRSFAPPIATVRPTVRLPRATAPKRRARSARAEQQPPSLASMNHPAPEQPLTDEERLLLRLAHRATPDEFDVLNPDARDAQAKSEKAEFQQFFGPPPTGDSE